MLSALLIAIFLGINATQTATRTVIAKTMEAFKASLAHFIIRLDIVIAKILGASVVSLYWRSYS